MMNDAGLKAHQKARDNLELLLLKHPRSESGGGWAPVSEALWSDLHKTFSSIVCAVVGPAPDGDLSIEYSLTDRTKTERSHYYPVPYAYKDLEGHAMVVLANLRVAMSDFDRTTRCHKLKLIDEDKEKEEGA